LFTASAFRSRASFWVFPVSWMARHGLGWSTAHAVSVTGTLAVGAVVAAVVVLTIARRRDADPALLGAGTVLVYLLGATYVLPWYAGWAILVTALAWRSRIAWLAQAQAATLLLVYVDRPGIDPDSLHSALHVMGSRALPAAQALAFVAVVAVSARRLLHLRTPAPKLGRMGAA
jgi:hypothetical protein